MKKFLIALFIVTICVMPLNNITESNNSIKSSNMQRLSDGDVRFKTTCNFDHSAKDDPIVKPNLPGASHLHDFTGRRDITAFTISYEELLLGTTTCNDREDHAGYWTPSVYINGIKRNPSSMTAYYRLNGKTGLIEAYPDGLKIVAGYDLNNINAPHGVTGWQCNGIGLPKTTPSGCTTNLTIRINFPDCWDGINIDSLDHRSHMAYATNGICPNTHKHQVPALTTYTHFGNVNGPVTISSGNITQGLHGDFFNGWVRSRLLNRINDCLMLQQKCPSGD